MDQTCKLYLLNFSEQNTNLVICVMPHTNAAGHYINYSQFLATLKVSICPYKKFFLNSICIWTLKSTISFLHAQICS